MNPAQFLLILLLFPVISSAQQSRNACVVIAHRGNHVAAPENSLESLEEAVRVGADYVEIDLRTTADGKLVIMHDRTLDRTTTGRGTVRSLTLQQVKQLALKDNRPAAKNSLVPEFEQILRAAKGRIGIYLDFKDASVIHAWAAIRAHQMENQLVVYINTAEQYREWRQLAPAVPLMVSLPDSVRTLPALTAFLNVVDAEILDGDWSDYTPEMVKFIYARNRKIWADIQQPGESPALWQQALDLGITGLQTDHPEALVEYLKSTARK